eukprot:2501337-Rhodomonas_salina.2
MANVTGFFAFRPFWQILELGQLKAVNHQEHFHKFAPAFKVGGMPWTKWARSSIGKPGCPPRFKQ